ncbi:MAG: hypothetical protein QOE23_4009 [Pseudonocardiales bacterium]|nr:hypothetical protein [Pseudonocardiales bacterium]
MSEFKFEAGGTKKQQVAKDLRRRIRTGDLPLGESIGDLFKLAEYYGCSWGTVRDAQRPLVEEGLLSEVKAGVPTRVIAVPAGDATPDVLPKLRELRREIDAIIKQLELAV